MNEKRVTEFCKCLITPACKVFVCMIAVAFSITAFSLQGAIASSVGGAVELELESVQDQEPLMVSGPGEVLGLPEKPRVEDSFFDKTLFVGDSITIKLEWYVTEMRRNGQPDLLGNSRFFCSGGAGDCGPAGPGLQEIGAPFHKGQEDAA